MNTWEDGFLGAAVAVPAAATFGSAISDVIYGAQINAKRWPPEEFLKLSSRITAAKKPKATSKPRSPAVIFEGVGRKVGELSKMIRDSLGDFVELVINVRISIAEDFIVES